MTTLESPGAEAWFRLERDRLEVGGAWTIGASAKLDRDLRGLNAEGAGPCPSTPRRSRSWTAMAHGCCCAPANCWKRPGVRSKGPTCPTAIARCGAVLKSESCISILDTPRTMTAALP
jgi:hypothetical protein